MKNFTLNIRIETKNKQEQCFPNTLSKPISEWSVFVCDQLKRPALCWVGKNMEITFHPLPRHFLQFVSLAKKAGNMLLYIFQLLWNEDVVMTSRWTFKMSVADITKSVPPALFILTCGIILCPLLFHLHTKCTKDVTAVAETVHICTLFV